MSVAECTQTSDSMRKLMLNKKEDSKDVYNED